MKVTTALVRQISWILKTNNIDILVYFPKNHEGEEISLPQNYLAFVRPPFLQITTHFTPYNRFPPTFSGDPLYLVSRPPTFLSNLTPTISRDPPNFSPNFTPTWFSRYRPIFHPLLPPHTFPPALTPTFSQALPDYLSNFTHATDFIAIIMFFVWFYPLVTFSPRFYSSTVSQDPSNLFVNLFRSTILTYISLM